MKDVENRQYVGGQCSFGGVDSDIRGVIAVEVVVFEGSTK